MSQRDGTTRLGRLLCKVGLHRWPTLSQTWWLEEPRLTRNELGLAIEARVCERCGRLTDVSTWRDSADEDYGFPKGIGPLAGALFLEVIAKPRPRLSAPAIPIQEHTDA